MVERHKSFTTLYTLVVKNNKNLSAMVGDMTDFQDGLGEYGKQRFRELVTTRDARVEQRLSELFRKTDEPKK